MRSSFDKWLSQPSTLCLLRRLLSNDDILFRTHTRPTPRLAPRTQQCRQSSSHTSNQPSENGNVETSFQGFGRSRKQDAENPTNQAIVRRTTGKLVVRRTESELPTSDHITTGSKRSTEQTKGQDGGRMRRTKRTTIAATGQAPVDTTKQSIKSMPRSSTSVVRRKLSGRRGIDSQLREEEALVTVSKPNKITSRTQGESTKKVPKKTSKAESSKVKVSDLDDFASNLFSAPDVQTNPLYRPLSSYGDQSYHPPEALESLREEDEPGQNTDEPYDEATTLQELGLSREGLELSVDQAHDVRRRELYDEVAMIPHGLAQDTTQQYSPAAIATETFPFALSTKDADARQQLPSTKDADTKQQLPRLWLLHDGMQRKAVVDQILFLGQKRDEDGIMKIWTKLRDSSYSLPVHKSDTREAWHIILVVAVNRAFNGKGQFLEDVYSQFKAIRQIYNESLRYLHKQVVGRFFMLRSLSQETKTVSYASVWHARLVEDGFASNELLLDVIDQVITEKAILEFKMACENISSGAFIDRCIEQAVQIHSHNPEVVKQWKRISRQPPDSSQDTSFSNLSIDGKSRANRSEKMSLTRTDMSKALGEVHGVKEQRLSDDFCARIAATTMFSIGTSIRCLQILGISTLGPTTTQQLVSRAEGIEEAKQVLESLSKAGLLKNDLVYVRSLRKFAKEDDRLLEVFLASDQHAEEYENTSLQRKLMQSHLEKHEWDLAHIAAFAASCKQDFVVDDIWNGLIQAAAKQKNLSEVNRLLNAFQLYKIKLSENTMKSVQTEFWLPRAPGKMIERSSESMASVVVISNALMQYADAGGWIDPELWSEMLTRFGMTNRTKELYRLANWIANRYKNGHMVAAKYGKMVGYLDIVFTSNMLRAFVIWFWRAAAYQNQLTESNMPWIADTDCERWALGVFLAKKLSQKDAQHSRYVVRQAIIQQLWTIFGPSISNRKANRLVQRRSQLTMKHYISHIESIWPGVLSRSERGIKMLEEDGHSTTTLLLKLFGPRGSMPTAGVDLETKEQIEFYWRKSEKIVTIPEEADTKETDHTDTTKTSQPTV